MKPVWSWETACHHLQRLSDGRISRAIEIGRSTSKQVAMEGALICHGRYGESVDCAAMETGEFVITFRLCDQKATAPLAIGDRYVPWTCPMFH